MDIDYGVIIGLIATGAGAGVLTLSYVGAYLLGRARGQRDALRELPARDHDWQAHRLLAVEGAVDSVSKTVSRLAAAQRLLLVDQRSHDPAPVDPADPLGGIVRPRATNTPA